MGRYISYEELLVRYPLVDTWSDKASHVDSFIIYYAENEVDAMLSPAYSVPFDAAHPTVKDLSFDVCKYKVLADQDAKKAKEIYDLIQDRVENLLNGKAQIITGSGTLAPSAPGEEVWSNTKDYLPTHTMLDEDNAYTQVDSSQLFDLENERM